MKKRKFFRRILFLVFLIGIIFIGGAFIYVKFSPELNINSTNSIVLYDSSNDVFFKGNEAKEWSLRNNIVFA